MSAAIVAMPAFGQSMPRAPLEPGDRAFRQFNQMLPAPSGRPDGGVTTSSRPAMRPPDPLDAFRAKLSAALDASTGIMTERVQIVLVNTTNGLFSARLALQDGLVVQVPALKVTSIPCPADCLPKLRIDYHDGIDPKYVEMQAQRIGYIIVHPLYQRFEIIDATQAQRLAGLTR